MGRAECSLLTALAKLCHLGLRGAVFDLALLLSPDTVAGGVSMAVVRLLVSVFFVSLRSLAADDAKLKNKMGYKYVRTIGIGLSLYIVHMYNNTWKKNLKNLKKNTSKKFQNVKNV